MNPLLRAMIDATKAHQMAVTTANAEDSAEAWAVVNTTLTELWRVTEAWEKSGFPEHAAHDWIDEPFTAEESAEIERRIKEGDLETF